METKDYLKTEIEDAVAAMLSGDGYHCDFLGYDVELLKEGYAVHFREETRKFADLEKALKWILDTFFQKVYDNEVDYIMSCEG